MTEYEYLKKGLKFSLENIWKRSKSSDFKTMDNRTWLFVKYDYLVKRYCDGTPADIVTAIMNDFVKEGYLAYKPIGYGDKLRYMYSLSAEQEHITLAQPERSFDPDEFFRASLVKSYDCEVF